MEYSIASIKPDPLISIIIPVHNRVELIQHTLQSVIDQTYQNWECIIVDDHSIDNTLAVCHQLAKDDHRIHVYSLPDGKRYASAARNYGLQKARGEFINFLDSDDILLPQKLEKQMAVLKEHPEIDVVACQHAIFVEHEDVCEITPIIFMPQEKWLDAIFIQSGTDLPGLLWQTDGPLWRKSVLIELAGWNEELTYWEDPELNLRAMLGGFNIVRLEEVLFYLRKENPGQLTGKDHLFREPEILRAMMLGWQHMIERNEVNDFRRHLFALFIYMTSVHLKQRRKFLAAFLRWVTYTKKIYINWRLVAKGIILLLPYRQPLCSLQDRFREELFSPLNQLKSEISLQTVEKF